MTFRRAAASFVVGMAIILAIPMTCEPHQGGTTEREYPPEQRQGTVSINNETSSEKKDGAQNETPCWYASPEWALVFVGIATLAAIWYQAVKTKDAAEATRASTEATRIAANAARASADALVNIERAWIFADIGQLPADFVPTTDAFGVVTIPISLRNYGRTPGRIVRLCLRAYQMQIAGVLPEEPEYRDIRAIDFVLPPNISVPQGIAIEPPAIPVVVSDFVAIREGTVSLYVYGFIDYIAFGITERQTRFCWRYHVPHGFNRTPEGFHIFADIPSIYTKCT